MKTQKAKEIIYDVDDSAFTKFKKIIFKIMLIAILILIGVIVFQCSSNENLRRNENILEQNILAMTTMNQRLKNENDQYYTKQNSLILNIKELEQVNKELASEVKSYKEKIAVISKIGIDVSKIDTVIIQSSDTVLVKDSNFVTHKINWWHNDETLKFDGYSMFNMSQDSIHRLESKLISYAIKLQLYTGIMQDKSGIYSVYARSDNPNVTFEIESNISPDIFYQKKKKWGIGLFIGPSINLNLLEGRSLNAGMAVGIGVSYDIISF